MRGMRFTHLHVHSNFSLLDGAAPLRELVQAAKAAGMEAVALTDHDSLAGAVRFFQAAQEAGIKPIIGVEFTVTAGNGQWAIGNRERLTAATTETAETTGAEVERASHLVLLAQDNEGYSNLCRLVTAARLGETRRESAFSEKYAEVDRKRPLLSQENLRRHSSHLIALSGCQERGEIPRLLAEMRYKEAHEVAQYYRELFGPENFFIELHNHLLPRPNRRMRYRLADLAARLDLQTVATNNVHYVEESSYRLQDVMVCIKNLQSVDEPHPDRKLNAEYYLKSPQEMAKLFADQPEAVAATEAIAERCAWELDLESFHFPEFDLEELTAGKGQGAKGKGEQQTTATTATANGRPHSGPTFAEATVDKPASPDGNGESGWKARPTDGFLRARAEYPVPEKGETTREYLRRLCYLGARRLYGKVEGEVRERLEHELTVIEDKGLCDYFLIVWDIVRFARSRSIPCSGRGSAGDCIVSYVLGITSVDPIAHDLLFERFLNPERRNMPDIDVDFCARRRDEVTAYIYDKYGAERVAAVCTVNTYRARSAVREVGKALNFPEEELGKLAEVFPHIHASEIDEAAQKFPEVRDADLDLSDKRLLIELCEEISGFPRHLSVHVGGLLIGARPLTEMVPLELANKGIVIAQFDKDDVEALGLVKMDILGLRIHTAIDDCLDHIEQRTGERPDLDRLPLDDEAAYRLLRSTKTVGLFQLESPGQRNLLGRTQPHEFEEIIANISLFRPGPVQADMITPYIRRKHGLEPVVYAHPALRPILERTYGVVVYQEQVLRIAQAIAGFSLGQADVLRRMMTHDAPDETLEELHDQFLEGAERKGVQREVAEEIFGMIRGFAAYGFNKAHAACFGKVSYQTAYLKAHYPAEFLAGILSSQPMGFYPPRTVAEEAKRWGVGLLPPCVNASERRCTVEPDGGQWAKGKGQRGNGNTESYDSNGELQARSVPPGGQETGDGPTSANIRLGLGMVRGLSEAGLHSILEARERDGPFQSLEDFCKRARVPRPVVENLILVRAFDFTGRSVQELLWMLGAMPRTAQSSEWRVASGEQRPPGRDPRLLAVSRRSEVGGRLSDVAADLHILGVSTTKNAFSFWRSRMKEMGVTPSTGLYKCKDGDRVRVAGIVVARARPPTRSGKTAIFISLEDEFGLVDVAVFEEAYQRCGRAIYSSPVLCVEGKLTRQGKLDLSVTAEQVIGLGSWEDFELQPQDIALSSSANRHLTPARGGERRQAASY